MAGRGVERGDWEKEKKEWRMAFWNIAGLRGKDENFWRDLSDWDVVLLLKIWVDEKEWERVRGRLEDMNGGEKWQKRRKES